MFEPKGERPEWQMIYDHVVLLAPGDVFTHGELDQLLGRDFRSSRSPIYDAMRRLEQSNQRTLATVVGVGYRVASASEHEGLARSHQKRSRRQLGKAVSKASSADRSALAPQERQRIDALEMSLRQQADMIQRLDTRTAKQAEELKKLRRETSEDVAEVSAKVDRIAELLDKHGINPNASRSVEKEVSKA
ncbi:helix-turn-helix domain-containing protein [Nocardiopsis synnemataformans]|uniref:helix-turn-helix domain-containing protein n=1 Tax=Nocardiopsis synnemataformans TaxID=61305 RepID=UPI003EBC0D15